MTTAVITKSAGTGPAWSVQLPSRATVTETLPTRATIKQVLSAVEPVLVLAAESTCAAVPQLLLAVAAVRIAKNFLTEPGPASRSESAR
jgi:hypothetical protein